MVPDFRTILVPIFGAFFGPRYWNSFRKSKKTDQNLEPKWFQKTEPFSASVDPILRRIRLEFRVLEGWPSLSIVGPFSFPLRSICCAVFTTYSIILLFLRVRIFEIYFVAIENLHGSIVGNRSHDGRGVGVVSIRIILFHR